MIEVTFCLHRQEASILLTSAGDMFRKVLEIEGWSNRALVNWGRAMCLRAEIAVNSQAAAKLYRAAIDKFEAVSEEDGTAILAKFR